MEIVSAPPAGGDPKYFRRFLRSGLFSPAGGEHTSDSIVSPLYFSGSSGAAPERFSVSFPPEWYSLAPEPEETFSAIYGLNYLAHSVIDTLDNSPAPAPETSSPEPEKMPRVSPSGVEDSGDTSSGSGAWLSLLGIAFSPGGGAGVGILGVVASLVALDYVAPDTVSLRSIPSPEVDSVILPLR